MCPQSEERGRRFYKERPTQTKNMEAEVLAVVLLILKIALRQTPTLSTHLKIEGRSLGEVTEDPNLNLRV